MLKTFDISNYEQCMKCDMCGMQIADSRQTVSHETEATGKPVSFITHLKLIKFVFLWDMYVKWETFSWNTNQVVSTTVFFNVKQHLLKAFFDKIKTDHHKWLFVAEKPVLQVFFKFFQNMSIWVSKDPSCKA